ncbi:MAG: AI-2E family transporter [Clostridium sp.]|uniref:AI-2E family transporter n=1 Tax=Clostridium culturomicium TaxID=1499683 RepID=UPI00058AEBF4|nr:AI-2E family transporter [Clostridium culturomicium]MDU4892094.1 AI-2E family transporter [Clostridium sp.]MDU7082481.1 AI-2E family transporter [Clostridium sp.]
MIDKLKSNKLYIKYGVIIIFIAIVAVLAVKIIAYWDFILDFLVLEVSEFFSIIAPILYAILLAYLLYQPIKYIDKFLYNCFNSKNDKIKKYNKLIRFISVLIMLGVVVILLILVYNFLIPPMLRSINEIIHSLPEFQAQLRTWTNELVQQLNSKNINVQNTGHLSGDIIDKVGVVAQGALNTVFSLFSNLSSIVLDTVVTIILTVYFLIDRERLIYQLRRIRDVLFPPRIGRGISIFIHDLDDIVGGFLVGEVLDSIIVGIVSALLLLLIRHPFAILIGVIAGVTNIIPYVGPIIGAALAFFFGIFTSIPLGIAGAVLLLLYQQIDGNFVQPKIVGDKIGLSPVWVLIAVLIGGSYFGALGMILSMPFAGLLRIYFNRYSDYKRLKEKI